MLRGHIILGPAIIMDKLSTILVEPKCIAMISKTGDIGKNIQIYLLSRFLLILISFLEIEVNCDQLMKIGVELEPIQLSIFSHRFMSIAEQMGR